MDFGHADAQAAAGIAVSVHTFQHIPLLKPPSFSNAHDETLQRAAFVLMQNPGETVRLTSGVLAADRRNLKAAVLMGHALLLMNRSEEAVAPLQAAARRSGDPAAETLLAAALGRTGRRKEALAQLGQTMARRPPFAPAFLEQAGQLDASGQTSEALSALEGATVLMPAVIDLQLALARLHIGRNDRVAARAILTKAHDAAPGRHDILGELARVLLLDGEYAAAADLWRRALALQPNDAMMRANYAVCLLEMGDRSGGETNLRHATRGRPDMIGRAVTSLASASHGRLFLCLSAAVKFLQV